MPINLKRLNIRFYDEIPDIKIQNVRLNLLVKNYYQAREGKESGSSPVAFSFLLHLIEKLFFHPAAWRKRKFNHFDGFIFIASHSSHSGRHYFKPNFLGNVSFLFPPSVLMKFNLLLFPGIGCKTFGIRENKVVPKTSTAFVNTCAARHIALIAKTPDDKASKRQRCCKL